MIEVNALSSVDCSFNILVSAGREEMEMRERDAFLAN